MTMNQATLVKWNSCSGGAVHKLLVLSLFFAVASGAWAQSPPKAPTVTMAAVPLTTAQRAQATMVNLNFRVPPGYHINSNNPKSEFLIPTALKMDLPTDIILGKIEYPAGRRDQLSFFAGRKIECVQRRFHDCGSRPSVALSSAGEIPDARRAALSGLRQCGLLSAENFAREF